jgi:hypothetical protein
MNRPESIARADSPVASARAGRIGVLIVNLGTPDATDAGSVRRYLREFLSDARVIENQGLIWKFVLNAIILPRRPRVKGRDYEKIWNRERNESPLKTITRAQAQKLGSTLEPLGAHIQVDWAMRYGNPSMATRIEAMQKAGLSLKDALDRYRILSRACSIRKLRNTLISRHQLPFFTQNICEKQLFVLFLYSTKFYSWMNNIPTAANVKGSIQVIPNLGAHLDCKHRFYTSKQ